MYARETDSAEILMNLEGISALFRKTQKK